MADNGVTVPVPEELKQTPIERKKQKWSAFLENEAAEFFTNFGLSKMSLEDDNGNKAKLSKTKDDEIKIEFTSTILM